MTANHTFPFRHPHVASKGPSAMFFMLHSIDRVSWPRALSVSAGSETMRTGQSFGMETRVLLNVVAESDSSLANTILQAHIILSTALLSSAERLTNLKSGVSLGSVSCFMRWSAGSFLGSKPGSSAI